ncbi:MULTISPECIES: CYTH domain-containing protein [Persicobacter]|uniref:CYTH domain-containing protein n=1 Tax=Persicobacter diffluens TaxID=981 RepID=A0AAN4VWG0_9BACT|nr:CYTH domain-containing protein [Persicobacter sp. CCB-QB2]GJM60045.1 CYTH domain-containing protein [Persicobacter diffluens]
MAKEIERKFLVSSDAYKSLASGTYFHQGYLNADKDRTVRVRIAGDDAFLTIKGITEGATRSEFEYDIPMDEAEEMLNELCIRPTIEKHRYVIPWAGFIWEIDEFHGENQGLVIAEIELPSEDTEFEKPDWIAEEVTEDPKFYNASLVNYPFKDWPEAEQKKVIQE